MQGAEIDGTLPPPQTELSGYAKIFHSYTYKGFRENISVRAHSDSLLHFTLAASPVNSTSSGQSSFARVQKHSAGRNGASSKHANPPPSEHRLLHRCSFPRINPHVCNLYGTILIRSIYWIIAPPLYYRTSVQRIALSRQSRALCASAAL